MRIEPLETRAMLSGTGVAVGVPEPIPGVVNTPDRERSASVSSDGLSLYFQRSGSFALNGDFNVPVDTEIMVSTRSSTDDPWGAAVPLGPPISTEHPETWPEISGDGNTLYFADTSDPPALDDPRPGGQGLGDLWMSTKDGSGNWQAPVNLGSNVNSPYREGTPDLAEDGLTLFFSSNRPGGVGDNDLWMTTRTSHTDPWQSPVNLGASINSSYLDVHPSISSNGLALAFASNRSSGGADFFDLWIATRTSIADPFGDPVNLRSQLPDGFEGTLGPEFTSDGSTLLFTSRGYSSSNSYDIWQVPITFENVLFADSFESGQWDANWIQDEQDDWFASTQRATDGDVSAEVDGRASDATLTMATPVDLSEFENAELRFEWFIEGSFDFGEYLAVDLSSDNGNSWQLLTQLSGNVDEEDVWHSEAIDLSPYEASNVLVRFRGNANRANEDANVDNVRIIASGAAPPVTPTLSIADISQPEGNSATTPFEFAVTRTGNTSQQVSVDVSTADGSANAGSDYIAMQLTTLTFLPGETEITVNVTVNGDTNSEGNEYFVVNLSNPVGATITDGQAVGTIVNDDAAAASLYIDGIFLETKPRDANTVRVAVRVRSATDDSAVAGVSVKVDFYGKTYTGVTDSNGEFRTKWIRNVGAGDYLADAYDLAIEGFLWDPLAGLDNVDDSDGDGKPDELLSIPE
jgi:hypothetical protein